MTSSPFFGLELFHFTPALEKRLRAALDDLGAGRLSAEDAVHMVLNLINGFLSSLRGDPQFDPVAKALAGQRLAVQVEGVASVTGTLSTGGRVRIEKGVVNGAPEIRVRDLETFGLLLTGKLDDVEALRSGRIQVTHMAELLKLLAPLVALQSKRKQEFHTRIQQVADQVLREQGY